MWICFTRKKCVLPSLTDALLQALGVEYGTSNGRATNPKEEGNVGKSLGVASSGFLECRFGGLWSGRTHTRASPPTAPGSNG